MVRDAEAHAEEDSKFRELADTRNRADALVHASEKALKDLGDKVAAGRPRQGRVGGFRSAQRAEGRRQGHHREEGGGAGGGVGGDRAAGLCGQQQDAGAGGRGWRRRAAGRRGGGKDEVLDAEFEEVDKDKDRKLMPRNPRA